MEVSIYQDQPSNVTSAGGRGRNRPGSRADDVTPSKRLTALTIRVAVLPHTVQRRH